MASVSHPAAVCSLMVAAAFNFDYGLIFSVFFRTINTQATQHEQNFVGRSTYIALGIFPDA